MNIHDTECMSVKVDNNEKVGYFMHATLTGILLNEVDNHEINNTICVLICLDKITKPHIMPSCLIIIFGGKNNFV